uniref:NADH-ubiquinone oxidoreductase chain 5 n=1 Tax=Crypturopus tuberculatus TaxID=686701 RepID=A0A1L5BW83_9CRUS|nr:NADH dehydrogenase subunit 5 [Crypturopus tuberculatus]
MKTNYNLYSVFSVSLLLASSMLFATGLMSVLFSQPVLIEWEIWVLRSVMLSMSLIFDWMSLVFLGSVCLIAGCIMKYSSYYMSGEANLTRFVCLLLLFVLSMWFLIISPNMVSLLLGWDGLGLTSYGLVIFYQSETAANAGMLTILSNRVGDVAILLSISLMFSAGSFDFYLGLDETEKGLALLIILAGASKSAQMPFSAWLPAAMAAPTPVSALVHSSTLVTAGVYMLIRFNTLLMEADMSGPLMFGAGLTMVMAGLSALFETDTKKVVALSTLSQLSLMIISLSLGLKDLAFFHLITHAMFKSTLFMSVGVMIHSSGGSQDGRSMSGFSLSSPTLSVTLGASNLALCGFPFMAGFYSKDTLLESMLSGTLNLFSWVLIALGTSLTLAYSLRLLYRGSSAVDALSPLASAQDSDPTVLKSVSALFCMSVLVGFVLHWAVVPISAPTVLTPVAKSLTMLVSALGGLASYTFTQKSALMRSISLKLGQAVVSNMWFLPFMSTKGLITLSTRSGLYTMKLIDMGWSEHYGGQGGRSALTPLSNFMQKSQKNKGVSGYLITMLALSSALFFSVLLLSVTA